MAAYGKLTFGKLSNKTWEMFRPPKRYPSLAGSALFRSIPRVARPQSAQNPTNRKKHHQQPAKSVQPPVAQLPPHQPGEQKKNGVNGQNGHINHPSNNITGRDDRSNPNLGSRNSALFPATPRQSQPAPRKDEKPYRPGEPGSTGEQKPFRRDDSPARPTETPSRPAQSTNPLLDGKRFPTDKPGQGAFPTEKNGKTTFSHNGSSSGNSNGTHERRSAWLPSTPGTRGPTGTPPVRPVQIPMEPQKGEEPKLAPENAGNKPNSFNPPVRPVEQNKPVETEASTPESPSIPVRPVPDASRPAPPPASRSASHPGQRPLPGQNLPGMGSQSTPAPTPLSAAALQRILSKYPDLPAQSALLGLCDDGLPVMLDLFDPAPGAMAIIGDERELQIEMLRSVIASAAMRNSPRSMQFVVLSMQPESWQKWISERGFDRHSLGVAQANEESAREWILRLADWTEDRRTGRRSGPPVLFVLDTLSFLTRLELDARLNFDWLAKEGPVAAIWPIAAISTELAGSLGSRLAPFGSKVLGYTDDPSLYIRVASVDPAETAEFRKRGEFAVRVGENLLRFRLPK